MRTSNDDDGFQQVWTLHMGQVTFCTVPRPNFHSTVRNHTVVCVAGRGRRWSLRLRNRTGKITEDGQRPRYFGRTLHMSESSTTKQMTRIRGGMCVYLLFFAITVRMTLQGSVLLLHPSLQASWRTSVCRNWVPRSGWAACSAWTTRHRPRRRRRWSGTMPTCTSQAKLRCQDTQTPRKTQPQNGHCSPLRASTDRVFFQPACSPDPSQIDSWAWTAVKREVFAIRGSIPLKAEASLAWAAVLPFHHLERLLREGENRFASCVANKAGPF